MLGSSEQYEVAEKLFKAERDKLPIGPLSEGYAHFCDEDAYTVQFLNAERLIKKGSRLVGYKVGLTSREVQNHFQVFQPDFGHLFSSMVVSENDGIDLDSLIQPKIEAELAFVMKADLAGPELTLVDTLRAVDVVMPALEIVDSRIRNWEIKAVDTIADNGSSARFVLGGRQCPIDKIDLPMVGMALSVNGEVRVTGAGAAVLGNPLNAITFLANELGRLGKGLFAGQIVLSGAMGAMLTVEPGASYLAEFSSEVGRVGVHVETRKEVIQ